MKRNVIDKCIHVPLIGAYLLVFEDSKRHDVQVDL